MAKNIGNLSITMIVNKHNKTGKYENKRKESCGRKYKPLYLMTVFSEKKVQRNKNKQVIVLLFTLLQLDEGSLKLKGRFSNFSMNSFYNACSDDKKTSSDRGSY